MANDGAHDENDGFILTTSPPKANTVGMVIAYNTTASMGSSREETILAVDQYSRWSVYSIHLKDFFPVADVNIPTSLSTHLLVPNIHVPWQKYRGYDDS